MKSVVFVGVLVLVTACDQEERNVESHAPQVKPILSNAEKFQNISEAGSNSNWGRGEELIASLPSQLSGPESHTLSTFYIRHADECAHNDDWSCAFDNLDRAQIGSGTASTNVESKRKEYSAAVLKKAIARTNGVLSRESNPTRPDIARIIQLWNLYEKKTGNKADARQIKNLNKRLKVVLRQEEVQKKKEERIRLRLKKKQEGDAPKSVRANMRLERSNIQPSYEPAKSCCRVCRKGKPCGDSCIRASSTCHKSRGCAC